MLNGLDIKKKALLIIAGMLVMLIFVVRFGFVKTLNAFEYYNKNKLKLERLSTSKSESLKYKSSIRTLQDKYGKVYSGTMSQSELFGLITETTDKYEAKVTHFSKVGTEQFESYELNTYIIGLQDDFKKVVNILFGFEVETNVGKVASVNMEYKNDRDGERVETSIYLQRVSFYEE